MVISKKLLALIMSLVVAFSVFTVTFAQEDLGNEGVSEQETTTQINEEQTSQAQEETTTPAKQEETTQAQEETTQAQEETTQAQEETTQAQEETTTQANEEETGEVIDNTGGSFTLPEKFFGRGRPALRTETFAMFVSMIRTTRNILTGRFIYSPVERWEVTVSDEVAGLCTYMSERSCLDVYKILTGFPDIAEFGRIVGKMFRIDTVAYREEMYAMRDEFHRNGEKAKGDYCHLIGSYFSGIEKAYLYVVPYGDEGLYEIALDLTYSDGFVEEFHPGIVVNFETGECYGRRGKDNGGMMDIGFNINIYDLMVYAPIQCWMRNFGFCAEYDILANMLPPFFRYRTRRFQFEYNNKEWMIQVWKGNYLITNGGEVGIYNRDLGSFGTFYNCASKEEELPMSLQVYHYDEMIINIEETRHWWVNGFKLANNLYHPYSLQLKFSIVFPDEEMKQAFVEAVERNLYKDVTYSVDGLKVTCKWY